MVVLMFLTDVLLIATLIQNAFQIACALLMHVKMVLFFISSPSSEICMNLKFKLLIKHARVMMDVVKDVHVPLMMVVDGLHHVQSMPSLRTLRSANFDLLDGK